MIPKVFEFLVSRGNAQKSLETSPWGVQGVPSGLRPSSGGTRFRRQCPQGGPRARIISKLSVNKLVIDNFIKGVGVLVNCLETKKLIYIETREFNPLKITIKNNLIKLDNFNKIENDNKIKLKDLMESYNSDYGNNY